MTLHTKQTMLYAMIATVAIGTGLLLYIYSNQQPSHKLARLIVKSDADSKPRPAQSTNNGRPRVQPQDSEDELNKLFAQHNNDSNSSSACPGYWELRGVNFQHRELAQRLCKNQVAYEKLNNRYPPCEISEHLPAQLLSSVNRTAVKTYTISAMTARLVTIYTYPVGDIVSDGLISSHNWEREQVTFTLSIVKKFRTDSVTFMDIGCNIGSYTLQARDAGIPTVAVDANIRNLARIRMSANDMNWHSDPKLKLMWMYFHSSVSLQYLNFGTSTCNVGGATINKDVMTDTIPVMTGRADDLLSSVTTDLVVMKIDIETSEHIFFSTGERLFSERKIVSVQMEFFRPDAAMPASMSPSFAKIVDFFTKRSYTLYPLTSLHQPVDLTKDVREWDGIWVRNDFLKEVRGY